MVLVMEVGLVKLMTPGLTLKQELVMEPGLVMGLVRELVQVLELGLEQALAPGLVMVREPELRLDPGLVPRQVQGRERGLVQRKRSS